LRFFASGYFPDAHAREINLPSCLSLTKYMPRAKPSSVIDLPLAFVKFIVLIVRPAASDTIIVPDACMPSDDPGINNFPD
jgi:hypothetical protein